MYVIHNSDTIEHVVEVSTVTPFFEQCVSMYCHNLLLIEGLPFRRAPAVFQKDASHLLRLFRVFSDPAPVDRDVGLAVQECMSLMAPAYLGVGRDKALLLEAALLENIYSVRTMVLERTIDGRTRL